jgi:hypothetical protein
MFNVTYIINLIVDEIVKLIYKNVNALTEPLILKIQSSFKKGFRTHYELYLNLSQ